MFDENYEIAEIELIAIRKMLLEKFGSKNKYIDGIIDEELSTRQMIMTVIEYFKNRGE